MERTIVTAHALGAEADDWTSPRFRGANAECVIAWVRSTTAGVIYSISLFGVELRWAIWRRHER